MPAAPSPSSTLADRLGRSARALGPWLFALLVTAAAFDISYQGSRAIESVLADNLLSYNALLTWRQLGDPVTSFTLTPSPYFIDLIFQLPIALLTDDFERFAYWEALAYACATSGAFVALFRALGATRWGSALAAALTMAVYFLCFPQTLVLHLYVPNHTSEVIGSLLGAALLLKMSKVARAPRRRTLALFGALVLVNMLSSTFFVATFLLPALGALAVLAVDRARRRTAAKLFGIALVSAAAGTFAQSWIAAFWWPIRKDVYGLTVLQSAKHLETVLTKPEHRVATFFIALGLVLAVGLLVRRPPLRVPLAFFLFVVLSCAGLPVLRGGFEWTYSFRFLQLPALLSLAVVVGTGVLGAFNAVKARPALTRTVWVVAAGATLLLLLFFRGPLSESSARSMTAPMLGCMRAPEHMSLLEDGLATVLPARFINASFRGPSHAVPNVVVQLERWHPPSLVASQNSTSWFRGGYRKGRRSINFVVTFQLPTESLAWLRQRVGAPDVVFRCPIPADWRPWRVADRMDEDVETWVWNGDDAKRTLEELVLHDNMRGLFVSPSDHEATLDAKWGMQSGSEATELVGDAWKWQRRDGASARVAWSRPMYVPAGRYRADVDLLVEGPSTSPGAAANGLTITALVGTESVARVPVAIGARSVSFEYVNRNPGGPTSGDNNWFVFDAEAADRVEVRAMRLTRLDATGPDPLRVFR